MSSLVHTPAPCCRRPGRGRAGPFACSSLTGQKLQSRLHSAGCPPSNHGYPRLMTFALGRSETMSPSKSSTMRSQPWASRGSWATIRNVVPLSSLHCASGRTRRRRSRCRGLLLESSTSTSAGLIASAWAMATRCVGTKERPVDPQYPDFGLRDLRAKGATDMYRADRGSIHKIQALLGHKSVQTTEIYLKGLVSEIVRPNEVPIIALVKK